MHLFAFSCEGQQNEWRCERMLAKRSDLYLSNNALIVGRRYLFKHVGDDGLYESVRSQNHLGQSRESISDLHCDSGEAMKCLKSKACT
jgi:hypothetical protein